VARDQAIWAEPAEGVWSLEIQVEFGEAQVAGQWATPEGEPRTLVDPSEAGRLAAGLAGMAAVLLSCERQPRSVPSPLLFDLTGLQREATHRFGFSAQEVLEAAQGLYEDRWISYPRTNSRCLTVEDAALAPEILAALRRHPEYGPALQEIADQGWALGARISNPLAVDDHPGLHPTPVCPGSLASLPETRRKVFDLIARRFLAAFFPDCQGHDLRLMIQVGTETFRATGFAQAEAGWLRVFPAIPEAITPQHLAPALGSLPSGARGWSLEAQPIPWPRERPRPFSEAELLGAMQNGGTSLKPWEEPSAALGLGTAATRTRTLEDLLAGDQPLASRAGGLLHSTERGRTLIATLPIPALKSADLTRKWEAGLSAIQHGERSAADFLAEVRGQISGVVQAMRDARDRANALAQPCPKCGAPLTLHRYPQFLLARCSGFPECPVQYAIHEDRTPVEGLCGNCGGPVGRTRKGFRLCNGCGTYQTQAPWLVVGSSGSTVLNLPDPCPVCRQGRWEVKFGAFGGYVRCSAHPACKVTFGSMKGGIPKGGFCVECGGPCQETRNRKRVCVVCSKWQKE